MSSTPVISPLCHTRSKTMRNVISFILGGGKGTRLFPLTEYRSKPAVPLAGKYRLIDIPISNCLNSQINRIYLLTQFNSVSLHRHIRQTYKFDRFDGGFVEILAAQQTMEGADWYQGTADAVRKHLRYLEQENVDYVLILSGDQLYRMDYNDMLRTHVESGADVTISAVPITPEQAKAFGIMRLDDTGRVRGFLEKPQTKEELDLVRTDPAWIESQGVEAHGRDCLASMGIYLFNRNTLLELLRGSEYADFGKEVFPLSIRTRKVQTHLFDGYWEDIGTIRAFYDANLALAGKEPPFKFVEADAPIYTHARFLPPTRVDGANIKGSMIADGCELGAGAIIEHSIIGLRYRIGGNATIKNSILMGADNYESPKVPHGSSAELPPIGIGEGSKIDGAIIDKNCRIGRNVSIHLPDDSIENADFGDSVVVRDGVIVVKKGAVLPDGWSM